MNRLRERRPNATDRPGCRSRPALHGSQNRLASERSRC